MKTQILQLEPHDDIISIRDKLNWRQASRVLLIWPKRGLVLARRLDLVLLLRHSQSMGIQLALVTEDPEVRYNARELGLSVFGSAEQAQRVRWKHPWHPKALRETLTPEQRLKRRQLLQERRKSPGVENLTQARRVGLFTLAVLAVLSIAAAVFPSARIELNPLVKTQEIELEVRALPEAEQTSRSGFVPLRTVSAVIEGSESQPTSGQMWLPDGYASGEATFTNLTDAPVPVPTQLVVTAPGSEVRFATQRAGQVPAGPGETLDLPVQALQPGSVGNLPAGRLTAIQGNLGASLTVSNASPTTGGRQISAPAATSSDRSRLYDRLNDILKEDAVKQLRASLEPGDVLLGERIEIARTLENSIEPAEGEPGEQLNLLLRQEFRAPVIKHEDLVALGQSILDANLPPGFIPRPDTLGVEPLSLPRLYSDGEARWRVRFARQVTAEVEPAEAASLVLGQPAGQALVRLQAGLPLAAPPKIQVRPSWWPRLPLLPIQITVEQVQVSQP